VAELDKMAYTATAQTTDGCDAVSRVIDDPRPVRAAKNAYYLSGVRITAPAGERWKASIACAGNPAPHAATSMLRAAWKRPDRLRMWPARG